MLARDGHRVTLFERFDAPRPIGSGLMLQPTGLAVLDRMGLGSKAIALATPIERIFGMADGRTVLDVRYSALGTRTPMAIGIHRPALFELLHSAVVEDGIKIRTNHCVGTGWDRPGFLKFENGSSEGPFDLIIDALGSRSPLSPPCGRDLAYGALWATLDLDRSAFEPNALQQRYRRANVMAGVLPLGGGKTAFFWSLRADRYEDWKSRGLKPWKDEVRTLWPATEPLLKQIESADELTFARYSHRTVRQPITGRIVQLGDSWHSASPQLGQGANMALLDAFALVKGLREAANVKDALAQFVHLRRRHVRLYQLLTAILTPVYQSDSRLIPLARDRLVGPLSKIRPLPWLQAALVSGLVGDPLGRLGIDFARGDAPR